MSTNYYIHKRNRLPTEDLTHIGKSVFVRPKGEFIWAIDPNEFIKKFHETPGLIVVDEYGERLAFVTFMSLVHERKWNLEYVGTSFS
jgi:hypothetical protein